MAITIVGLGPGRVDLLTKEAWDVLVNASRVYFRTLKHPTIEQLPPHIQQISFDEIYDRCETIDHVFSEIVEELLLAGKTNDVVYAVPGHPFIAESTVILLVKAAKTADIEVRVVAGLSYIELCLTALEVDGIEGLQLFDALDLEQQQYPAINADYPVLIGQVHCEIVASELKFVLGRVYPENHRVNLIHGAGNVDQVVESLLLDEIDHSDKISYLTTLYLPPLPKVSTIAGLAETVSSLRSPNGCPKVKIDTSQSLSTEMSRVSENIIAAIIQEDEEALCESLGEQLYHIVLQAEISAEDGGFGLTDIIARIDEKLKARLESVLSE